MLVSSRTILDQAYDKVFSRKKLSEALVNSDVEDYEMPIVGKRRQNFVKPKVVLSPKYSAITQASYKRKQLSSHMNRPNLPTQINIGVQNLTDRTRCSSVNEQDQAKWRSKPEDEGKSISRNGAEATLVETLCLEKVISNEPSSSSIRKERRKSSSNKVDEILFASTSQSPRPDSRNDVMPT